jgi:Protein of unknown function (DUF3987)
MEGKRQPSRPINKVFESTAAVKARKLPDWLDAFDEYTKGSPAPALFKKWAGISTLAMAMERKVWVRTNMGNLYPNLYIMFIAPPGVGKSILTSIVQDMIMELGDHHLAPSSVSRASLIDALMLADRRIVLPQQTPPVLSFNSLAVVQNEMGVFLPAYDVEFMATLTDLYDGKRYHEKKRSKDINNMLDAPQLNLLGATTVAYLFDTMPEQAWGHGFLSRTILIHSGENIVRSLFDEIDKNDNLWKDLIFDLRTCGAITGKVSFEPEAAKALDAWHRAKGPPAPEHPKLASYNSRRSAHLLKLCTVACVSAGNELVITLEHYNRALSWLLEAEMYMPDIFKSISVGGDAKAIEDVYYWAYKVYIKGKKPIAEASLVEHLANKVPSHSVERILQVMVKAGLFTKQFDGYVPRARKDA